MFALTHLPSPSLDRGLRTFVDDARVDSQLAASQHRAYSDLLTRWGLEVRQLRSNRSSPDSAFIEDTAVVLDEVAVVASMGSGPRTREPAAIAEELRSVRPLARIEPPATLEGGDVLRLGRTLVVGHSCRTNRLGIAAFEAIVRRYGYRTIAVPVSGCLHLKTACTALPDGRLLINPRWLATGYLAGLATLPVPVDEPWSANVLCAGGTVLQAAGHERCRELIDAQGFDVEPIDISEFAKVEGGVTCLSILVS